MRVVFFWKCSKYNTNSKNAQNNWEKIFGFWDKCIWIVCVQLFLLIREYVSLAVNLLRRGLKNFHESQSDFCNSITFTVITRAGKSTLIKTESVFQTVYHDACRDVLSNGSVETFIWLLLSWSVISEKHKLWGSSFFENVRNLMQIRKMQKKIEKKCFVFEIKSSEIFAFTCLYY